MLQAKDPRFVSSHAWLAGMSFVLACFCAGCLQTNLTQPPRSAVEQLLLSTAADRAVQTVSLSSFDQERVFVDTNYFGSYDRRYALGAIRDALSSAGALLVDSETNADIVIEARSGALSIDSTSSLIGIPKTGLPVPFSGTVPIPEISLFKSDKQFSTAKFALLAYSTHSREHYFSTGPMVGRSHIKYYKFLGFISYTSTDIPEKRGE
jgi:Family of unknown function (DUF6655)